MWLLLACAHGRLDPAPSDTGARRPPVDSDDTAAHPDDTAAAPDDTAADTAAEPGALRLAIPAYVWPEDGTYTAWVGGAAASGGLVVLNPASGPGSARQDAYVAAVAAARAAGATVLGYVHTSYGARAAADVDADVRQWAEFYGVDGIFFDEVASGCEAADWYAARAAAADATDANGDAFVAYNPGTASCEAYLDVADVVVVAEDAGGALLGYAAPPWTAAYDPARFWLLAHSADAPTMRALLDLARAQRIGNVYVTDDALPNPWDALPSYWDAEQTDAASP